MQRNNLIRNSLLIIIANFLLAFASALFFVPMNIVSGGMNGVSLIFYSWFAIPVELTTAMLAWFLFFIGLIFLGKTFTAQTFLSTLLYPIFFFIFVRYVDPTWIGFSPEEETHRLLASIFGGGLVGLGMGLAFLAGGSTGGFDIVMMLGQKFYEWKASVTSLVIDIVIIGLGMFTFGIVVGLYGVMATIVNSIMIEIVFVGLSKVYLVTIVSTKSKDINQFIIEKLERGSTIFPAKGGFKQQPLDVIQVAIQRREYFALKQHIATVDPTAFVMINQARAVLGLGFNPLHTPLPSLKKKSS
ncbi:MAG: YitT family protein [Bacilli bacterium]